MLLFSIAFLLGDCYLQTFSQLPNIKILSSAFFLGLIFAVLFRRLTYLYYLPFVFVLGLGYSTWYTHSQLLWTLAPELENKPTMIVAEIATLPEITKQQITFVAALKNHALIKLTIFCHQDHLLICQKHYRVGETYQWLVRLKRIHSTQNPGGFDFEAFALQKGWRAAGNILVSDQNKLLSYSAYRFPIEQFRQRVQEKIMPYLPNTHTAPWLLALMLGDRNNVDPADWQILRNTGTNHLMAIAGLHIGLLTGLIDFLISFLWRRSQLLMLTLPASEAGAYGALLIAWCYSALAGFSLPTQRACCMLTIFILSLVMRRTTSCWSVFSLTLLIMILINPLDILTDSFWLSFTTIALIIYGMSGRLSPSGFWWKWGRVQWVIGIGLLPCSLLFFQQGSLVSFIANTLAIPFLGFMILPVCFLSLIFLWIAPSLSTLCLWIADKNLSLLWNILTKLAHWHFSSWYAVMPTPILFISMMSGLLLLLLPSGFKGRWLGLFLLLPLIFYQPRVPALGEVDVSLLDVGQGLAVVIQTAQHTLVYDAGPKFNVQADMGERVVLPYLRTQGIKQLDMLVVSHGDNDHIGGSDILISSMPIAVIKTSVLEKFLHQANASLCLANESWVWDQVHFRFLYPSKEDLHLGNDSSCVLQIDNGKQRILLTGDIEKYAESILMTSSLTINNSLSATLLIAPHHGSKTSKLTSFINAVHPQFVFYATGYLNRYHFPHPSVVAAYTKIQSQQYNTADLGMLSIKLDNNTHAGLIESYRNLHKRYWYAR